MLVEGMKAGGLAEVRGGGPASPGKGGESCVDKAAFHLSIAGLMEQLTDSVSAHMPLAGVFPTTPSKILSFVVPASHSAFFFLHGMHHHLT